MRPDHTRNRRPKRREVLGDLRVTQDFPKTAAYQVELNLDTGPTDARCVRSRPKSVLTPLNGLTFLPQPARSAWVIESPPDSESWIIRYR